MYLLNPDDVTLFVFDEVFTFHYVSIKSAYILHDKDINTEFTFHYVSIKSHVGPEYVTSLDYLHSTMYLLNRC